MREYRKSDKYKEYNRNYMRKRRAKKAVLEEDSSIYDGIDYKATGLDAALEAIRSENEARSDFIEQGRFQPTIVDVTDLTNGGMRVTYEFTPNEVLVADYYLANNDSYLDMMALVNEKIKAKMISLCRDLLKTSTEIDLLTSYAYKKATLEIKQEREMEEAEAIYNKEQDAKNRNEYMRKYRDSDKYRKYIREYRRKQRLKKGDK